MIKKSAGRRRNPKQPPRYIGPAVSSSTPSGPAGGDLSGTYPNPSVADVSGVNWSGDLGGSGPAPIVTSLAHATVGPTIYPAGNGSNLYALPAPPTLGAGTGTLDSSGQLIVVLSVVPTAFVAVAQGGMFNPTGWLRVDGSGTTWTIVSSAGAADANVNVMYIYY